MSILKEYKINHKIKSCILKYTWLYFVNAFFSKMRNLKEDLGSNRNQPLMMMSGALVGLNILLISYIFLY